MGHLATLRDCLDKQCRAFEAADSGGRGRSERTWDKLIRRDVREKS